MYKYRRNLWTTGGETLQWQMFISCFVMLCVVKFKQMNFFLKYSNSKCIAVVIGLTVVERVKIARAFKAVNYDRTQ